MILLNDDFASIVDGVEEGRKIFDNLKKCVAYMLQTNVPEIVPFVVFIIWEIPLPLSAIYMLVVCVGTDILPAIALAYEEAELDIMTRLPRTKDDHLVNNKLITHAYLQLGWFATAAGHYAYLSTMMYLGFDLGVQGIQGMANLTNVTRPLLNDVFNAADPRFGNSQIPVDCTTYTDSPVSIDMEWSQDDAVDLRMVFLTCNTATKKWDLARYWATCQSPSVISSVSNKPVCYTTEAVKWGQTAFFAAIVITQLSNVVTCKSKRQSFIFTTVNPVIFYGQIMELGVVCFLLYTPGVLKVFGARELDGLKLIGPGCVFSALLLCWDETRKKVIRSSKPENGVPGWFEDNLLW